MTKISFVAVYLHAINIQNLQRCVLSPLDHFDVKNLRNKQKESM